MSCEPVYHSCLWPDGPQEGDLHTQVVTEYDIEDGAKCPVCRKPLANFREILAHLYGIMTAVEEEIPWDRFGGDNDHGQG